MKTDTIILIIIILLTCFNLYDKYQTIEEKNTQSMLMWSNGYKKGYLHGQEIDDHDYQVYQYQFLQDSIKARKFVYTD